MAKDNQDKNYSEPKERTSNKHCRFCQEQLPKLAIYKLNKIALKQGYCSWGCLIGGMDSTTIVAFLKEEREKTDSEKS